MRSQYTVVKIRGVLNDNISLANCFVVELDQIVSHNLTGMCCGGK